MRHPKSSLEIIAEAVAHVYKSFGETGFCPISLFALERLLKSAIMVGVRTSKNLEGNDESLLDEKHLSSFLSQRYRTDTDTSEYVFVEESKRPRSQLRSACTASSATHRYCFQSAAIYHSLLWMKHLRDLISFADQIRKKLTVQYSPDVSCFKDKN